MNDTWKDFFAVFVPLALLGCFVVWVYHVWTKPIEPEYVEEEETVIANPWIEENLPVLLDTIYLSADTNSGCFWYYPQNEAIVRDTLVEYWNEK